MAPAKDAFARQSLRFLDWPELTARLAERAQSERGAEACRQLALAGTPDEAREQAADLAELVNLLRAGESLASLGFPEIEPHLEAVERGAPLGAEELKQVAAFCETVASARRFFGRPRPEALRTPRLSRVAATLGQHDELVERARETFDAAGEIRDSASPELMRLRRDRDAMATRARAQAEELLRSEDFADLLQDEYVTLREDRFVLPVRSSFKSMGLGIVHDTSGSGETVYIEPAAMVELNNRLKVAQIEIRRESRRILEELAMTVAEAASRLREDREVLTALDVLAAKAHLAVAYGGAPVEIVDEPIVDLRAVRHPLLALRAKDQKAVTPNDLALGQVPDRSTAKVLVVSGPNAGGKTVLLKAVGLAALLARAGMQVPAEPGSRVGFFSLVLADVGDQQSVLGDLSTFSAHLTNIAGILEAAQEAEDQVLILCDELMAGTHPDQGAALARATLESLAGAPGLVITTTHYDSLKALTESDPRFRNAGMEYDLEHLRPTFRLKDGVPGRSYALDIAARMGLPEGVLARARELLGGTTLGLEEVLRNLEAREEALARAGEALDAAKRDLDEARQELEAQVGDQRAAAQALTRRERELALKSREAIDEAVREARDAIAGIVKEARKKRTVVGAEEARQELDRTAKAATASLPEPPPLALDVDRLKEALASRALGVGQAARDRAKRDTPSQPPPSLRAGGGAGSPPTDRPRAGGGREGGGPQQEMPTAVLVRSHSLDVRGLRADEALAELTAFLDRTALEGNADTVCVIHGHGTGALRKAVREYLATSPYVERFRSGGPAEGGDGVSVVSLKG
jgi:DNA mismatch repair protein MutS2